MEPNDKNYYQARTIIEYIDDHFSPDAPVLPDSRLQKDLGLDSLDKVELVMYCESEFDISIGDELVDDIRTVADMIRVTRSMIEEKPEEV